MAPETKGLVLLTGSLPMTLLWSGQGTGPSVCITAQPGTTQGGGSIHASHWGSFEMCVTRAWAIKVQKTRVVQE